MNITKTLTQNKWPGGNKAQAIVIHQWDDPAKKPSLSGVVSWFLNPASQVSAHYVVSGDTVIQMVEETDIAWHAMQANGFTIGIEVDPNTPGNTYKTVGELVRQIRSRRGNIPLKKHSDYVNTACPGNIDLNRIENEAKGDNDMELKTDGQVDALFLNSFDRHATPSELKKYKGKNWHETLDAIRKLPEFTTRSRAAKGLVDTTGQVDSIVMTATGIHATDADVKKYKGKNWHKVLDELRDKGDTVWKKNMTIVKKLYPAALKAAPGNEKLEKIKKILEE
jgi:hypothetical protein